MKQILHSARPRLNRIAAFILLATLATGVALGIAVYRAYVFPNQDGVYYSPTQPAPKLAVFAEGKLRTTLYALGDTGTGAEGQFAVARAMDDLAAKDKPACVLLLGDNFYRRGVRSVDDPLWESTFEKPYSGKNLQIPFYACLGNHDHMGNARAQVEKTTSASRWQMPAANYSFFPDPENDNLVEVFVIDTEPIEKRSWGYENGIATLEENLSKSNARWKIVMGHHPLQSGGRSKYTGDKIKSKLYHTLLENGVDLYISGHNHIMESGDIGGVIPYAVLGSGGRASSRPFSVIPDMHFAAGSSGFGKIQIGDEKLVIHFIDDRKNVLYSRAVFKRPHR